VMALGPMADGGWVTQTITVELEGGLAPWRVVRHRPWALGAIDEPAPNPLGVAAAPMNEPAGAPARPTAEADQPEPEAPEPEAPRADAEPDVIEIVP